MIDAIMKAAISQGGAMVAGIMIGLSLGLLLYRYERSENQKLTQQVIALSTAQVTAQVENKAVIQSIKDVLTQVLSRM